MIPEIEGQVQQKEKEKIALQTQLHQLQAKVNNIDALQSEVQHLRRETHSNAKLINELKHAYTSASTDNNKLMAQVVVSEQKVQETEVQLAQLTKRTTQIVQGMQLTLENAEKTAAKQRLELIQTKARLALMESDEDAEVIMMPRDMVESWEEFALGTMKESWDQNMIQLNNLLQIPNPTCKQLALPAPGDDNDREDQGQKEPATAIPHATTVGQTPVTQCPIRHMSDHLIRKPTVRQGASTTTTVAGSTSKDQNDGERESCSSGTTQIETSNLTAR